MWFWYSRGVVYATCHSLRLTGSTDFSKANRTTNTDKTDMESIMNGNEPIVFVTQDNRNDYSAAEQFGTVDFITRAELTKIDNSASNQQALADARRFLSFYKPGEDFILPTGNPMYVALIMMSLPKCEHNLLKWDSRRCNYMPYKIKPV